MPAIALASSSGEPDRVPLRGSWPHQLSHEPSLRVSEVLRIIDGEFPAVTASKLRFFDRQGLVSPQRTQSGYRQYSASDVERLRFVLREQRDFYHPLAVIQESLRGLDTGALHQAITPTEAAIDEAAFVGASRLAQLAGTEREFIDDLEQERLIAASVPGGYDRLLAPFVAAVAQFVAAGGDLREARILRNAATREVEHARTAGAPQRSKGDTDAAEAVAQARAHAAARLFVIAVDTELRA